MFFEDEKENLENLDNLEDLDLDLGDDGDDESISWDELLKDSPTEISDDVVSIVSPEQATKSEAKVRGTKDKPLNAKVDSIKTSKASAVKEQASTVKSSSTEQGAVKKDAFDVFGGSTKDSLKGEPDDLSDESENILKELDAMDEIDDVDDEDIKSIGIKTDEKRHNIPILAGILFAAILVIGSVAYMFMAPKSIAPVSQTTQESQVSSMQPQVAEQENPDSQQRGEVNVAGEQGDNIPVVDDNDAKKLKPDKKVVVSVESAGRTNPFLPTFDDFNNNLYSGLPAQVLMPPDRYGNDQDAQDLLEVSVSGILFDSVKPSAIVTINSMDYFVQKGDTVDDYLIVDINRQFVVIKKGTNIYKAGVGERFSQNMQISGAATYNRNGTRHYVSPTEDFTSASDVEVRAIGQN